jgi:hypothetical protein
VFGSGRGARPRRLWCGERPRNDEPKAASLTDYFGGGGTRAEQQASALARVRKQQTKVVACMRAEGFQYVPFVQSDLRFFSNSAPKEGEEVAYKRKNGYDLANGMEQTTAIANNEPKQELDPNNAIREKLPKAEQAAYDKALFGFGISDQNSTPQEAKGCQQQGYGGKEVEQANQVISSKYEALSKKVEAGPRIKAITATWVACMKQFGYTVSKQSDVYAILNPEQQKVFEPMSGAGAPPASDGSSQAQPTLPPAKLATFRKFELKVANADADCMSQKQANQMRAITAEYETAFIEENKAQLDVIKAANG